jgi:putative salt-induced outer membrane protein YdiY
MEMFMSDRLMLIAVSILIVCSSVFGDSIELVNGDRITGTVLSLADGKMVIETDLAGTITVAVENIRTVQSKSPLKIIVRHGTEVNAVVQKASDGKIKIVGDADISPQEIALKDIVAINPPAVEEPKWKGEISVGLTHTSGNTNDETTSGSGNLVKETEKDKISLSADIYKKQVESANTSEKITTEDWWKVRGKYDYFLSDKTYAFGQGRYEQDKVALLNKRVIVGGGYGSKWIQSDIQNLSVEAGLSNVYEEYDDGTSGSSSLSAILGYSYDRKINGVFSFIHDMSLFPNINDPADYYLTTTAEFREKINDRFYTNFRVLYDYDASPATGRKNADVKYILGIGANF